MKNYEIVYIIHPDLEGSIEKITERIKKSISDHDGNIIREESWGKKKLAYPIKKNTVGIYQFLAVEIAPSHLASIERLLRLSEEIIRYIIVVEEERKSAKTPRVKPQIKETVEKEKAEPAKTIKKPKVAVKKTKEVEKEDEERLLELDKKLKEIIGEQAGSEEKK